MVGVIFEPAPQIGETYRKTGVSLSRLHCLIPITLLIGERDHAGTNTTDTFGYRGIAGYFRGWPAWAHRLESAQSLRARKTRHVLSF
jgi:hypothetical protein